MAVYLASFFIALLITITIFLFIFTGAFFSIRRNGIKARETPNETSKEVPETLPPLGSSVFIHNSIMHDDDDIFKK